MSQDFNPEQTKALEGLQEFINLQNGDQIRAWIEEWPGFLDASPSLKKFAVLVNNDLQRRMIHRKVSILSLYKVKGLAQSMRDKVVDLLCACTGGKDEPLPVVLGRAAQRIDPADRPRVTSILEALHQRQVRLAENEPPAAGGLGIDMHAMELKLLIDLLGKDESYLQSMSDAGPKLRRMERPSLFRRMLRLISSD